MYTYPLINIEGSLGKVTMENTIIREVSLCKTTLCQSNIIFKNNLKNTASAIILHNAG